MQSGSASIAGAVFGAVGVLLGAFGAHALRDTLDGRGVELWHTATLYLFVHSLALLAVGLVGDFAKLRESGDSHRAARERALRIAGAALVIGCVVFCGSLYALALGAPRAVGIATPFGGVAFIGGWTALAVAAAKR